MAISPPSGAFGLNAQETDYITNTYHQVIDMLGQPVLYKIQQQTSQDAYKHPIYSYIEKTISAVISNITADEYQYVEEGMLPVHYANLWLYDAIPQIGDHVVWHDIEWEVRGSYPSVIGYRTIFFQVLVRRVLTEGTLTAGGELVQQGEGDP